MELAVDENPDESHVLEYAAAALLLEMCDSDLRRDQREIAVVREALGETYSLSEHEISRLVERATREGDHQVSFYPHVAVVNELCSP